MKDEVKQKVVKIIRKKCPEGFKKTKYGIIPSDWQFNTLSSISNISTGATPLRSKSEYFIGNIPWVKTTDLNNSYIYSTEEHINEKALKETSVKWVEDNSILIAMYGGFNQIGRTGLMKMRGTTNQAISSFWVDEEEYHSEYVLHWLNGNRDFWKKLAGSSRKDPNITKKDVEDFPIAKPKYNEQVKIAEVISKWDKAIELKEKFIEEKKKQKTGLMQKLLTGKVRLPGFEGEWKEVSLCDVMKNKTVKTTANDQHQILSCTKDGVVSQSEHFNKQIASANNIGYKILKKGEVVLSPMNLWLGGIDISNFDIGIVSPAYKVYQVNYSVIGENYLRNLLRSEYMLGLYDSISQKGASTVRRNLSIKDFEALEIKIPNDFEEMNAIDKVLYISGREIELLSSELEYLKEQKKGLMQLLLTGIVRVNTQDN